MSILSLDQCTPLQSVVKRVAVPGLLPFSIRDAEGVLLLAKGQRLESREQLGTMLQRGALVDIEEVLSDVESSIQTMPSEALPRAWTDSLTQLRTVLRGAQPATFSQALQAAVRPVHALIARDPDLAIVQVLRQGNPSVQAGVTRAAQGAIAAQMAAQVLGWSTQDSYRAFKAALTMNISIVELQGVLSLQAAPLTSEQREAVREHPAESRRLLQASGVEDSEWLDAVGHHHDRPQGESEGDPNAGVTPLARLLHWADVYTAMLSGRSYRAPLAPDAAARRVFNMGMRDPVCSALIKAFGLYPPGCTVRLASGVLALVVRRGTAANAPFVRPLHGAGREPGPEIEATPEGPHAVVQALAA